MADKGETIVMPEWLRQPFDTDETWHYFEKYRNAMPIARSLERLAKEAGINFAIVSRWADKYFWRQRAAAYDRMADTEAVGAVVRDRTVQSVRRESLATVESMHRLLNREIRVYLARQAALDAQGGDIEILKPSEMIRMLREVVLLGRLLMGESTENVAVNFDVGKLTDAELAFLTDIQRRQLAPAGVPATVETTGVEIDTVPEAGLDENKP